MAELSSLSTDLSGQSCCACHQKGVGLLLLSGKIDTGHQLYSKIVGGRLKGPSSSLILVGQFYVHKTPLMALSSILICFNFIFIFLYIIYLLELPCKAILTRFCQYFQLLNIFNELGKTCVINTDLSIIIGQRLSEYLRDLSNDLIQPFHFMDK